MASFSFTTARHPVMAVEDQPAAILCPHSLDDVVDYLLLKLGGIQ
jgi:hypothetical protein